MINHARTLLLNRPSDYFVGSYGSVYVDPAFRPLVLPLWLDKVRTTLIPTGLTPTGENIIGESLMRILHCPELRSYVDALDPRVTYTDAEDFTDMVVPNMVRSMTKSSDCDVVPVYTMQPENIPSDIGTAGIYSWDIAGVNRNTVRVTPSLGDVYTLNILPAGRSLRSQAVPLIPNYLSIRFDLPSRQLTGTFRVKVQTVVPAFYNVADYAASLFRLMANPACFNALFTPTGSKATTITALRAYYGAASELTIKFGCAVLAHIYQCDAVKLYRNS